MPSSSSSSGGSSNFNPTARAFQPRRRIIDATPNLLENTSLAPPDLPAFEPTPYQRTQARRRNLDRQRRRTYARAVAEERRLRQEEDAEAARLYQIANERYDDLNRHTATLRGLEIALENGLAAFEFEARYDQNLRNAYNLYHVHLANVQFVTHSPARQWDMMRWLNNSLPRYVLGPVHDLVGYHHEAARLRLELHEAENAYRGLPHTQCAGEDFCLKQDEVYACDPANSPFGWLPDAGDNGFADYRHDVAGRYDLRHVRASFEARKVWMNYCSLSMRFGFGALGQDTFNIDLDGHMHRFLTKALWKIDHDVMRTVVSMQVQSWGMISSADADVVALIRVRRLERQRRSLEADLQAFADDLIARRDMIKALWLKLDSARDFYQRFWRFFDKAHAKTYIDTVRTYKNAMAEGVAIDADNIQLGDTVQEYLGAAEATLFFLPAPDAMTLPCGQQMLQHPSISTRTAAEATYP